MAAVKTRDPEEWIQNVKDKLVKAEKNRSEKYPGYKLESDNIKELRE